MCSGYKLLENFMELNRLTIIAWKNLSLKEKCWLALFMSFACLWIFASLILTFKNNDLNTLQALSMPFIMFGYLLNPLVFQNPKQLNKSHFPQITKICFAIALFFLCMPFWSSLII